MPERISDEETRELIAEAKALFSPHDVRGVAPELRLANAAADLLAEVQRLRKENALLLQARDFHFVAANKYCDQLAILEQEAPALRRAAWEATLKLAKAREALHAIDVWVPPVDIEGDPYQAMIVACKRIARQALKEISDE